MRRVTFVAIVLFTIAGAGPAYAHPDVDQGREQLDQGDFQGALETFRRAESRDDLELADLLALYESRALVWAALGEEDSMRRDLSSLAAIAPEHVLPETVQPQVAETFQRMRTQSSGRPRLVVEVDDDPGRLRVSARVANDPTDVVRTVRVRGRVEGGSWVERAGSVLEIDAAAGQRVEYYAEAVGPGGVVVAREGSETEPHTVHAGAAVASNGDGGGATLLWVVIGVAGAVAAAAVVIAIIVAGGDDGSGVANMPSAPIVEW